MSACKKVIKRYHEDCKTSPSFRASCPTPTPPGTVLNSTFGSLYGNDIFRIAILNTNLEFDFPGPVSNTIADPVSNSITILNSGVFEISAGLISRNTGNGGNDVTYEIRRNNIGIPGSTMSADIGGGMVVTLARTIQVSLVAGDVITVVASSVNGLPEYQSASLSVNLIGP